MSIRRPQPLILPPGRYRLDPYCALNRDARLSLIMDSPGKTGGGAGLYDYASGLRTNISGGSCASLIGPGGLAWRGTTGDYILANTDARDMFKSASAQNVTVAFIRRKVDSTLRNGKTIGVAVDKFQFHAPYSNGTCYWDFGGIGPGRLTWAGYTPTQTVEMWLVHAGARGRAIWYAGVNRASATASADPTQYTPSATPDQVRLNGAVSESGDEQELYLYHICARQWSDSEIVSWFDNPYQMYVGAVALRPVAAANLAAVGQLTRGGRLLHGSLIRGGKLAA